MEILPVERDLDVCLYLFPRFFRNPFLIKKLRESRALSAVIFGKEANAIFSGLGFLIAGASSRMTAFTQLAN